MNEKTRDFIVAHKQDDIRQLALQASKYPDLEMNFIIRQINGLQKVKSKIPLFYENPDILFPVQLSLEQSSSESTSYYKSSLCEGQLLIDLTGGFGVDCYFMSQRFDHAIYVERNPELCEIAAHNFAALQKPHICVMNNQTELFLADFSEKADWIFIDPARRSESGKKVVLLEDCEPNVSALAPVLLEKSKHIMIKLSPMIDLSSALKSLPQTYEIHILSVDNECKEVLLIMNNQPVEQRTVTAVNILKNNTKESFSFIDHEEILAVSHITTTIQEYLYEPNSAVMKSGAFKLLSERFRAGKLHKNSHLYTSGELHNHFPGRKFRVIKVWDHSKQSLKLLCQLHPQANISIRNYPGSVDALRKKLRIKEGGSIYLFATTLFNEQKVIIECEKITS